MHVIVYNSPYGSSDEAHIGAYAEAKVPPRSKSSKICKMLQMRSRFFAAHGLFELRVLQRTRSCKCFKKTFQKGKKSKKERT